MKMKTQLNDLLSREMSRKEFLQYIGSGVLVLFGVSGLMRALLQLQPKSSRAVGMSYGSSAYGGSGPGR